MQLSFRQNLPQTEISVSKKNLKIHFNPKFFWGIAAILALIFFGIIFNLDKKENKEQKNKTKLEILKAKIRDGQSLEENEKKTFCELLWVVEKKAVADCENLSLANYLLIIEHEAIFPNTHKVLAKKLGIKMDSFEIVKPNILIKKFYKPINLSNRFKKIVLDVKNPDVGYWNENYLAFKPSRTRTQNLTSDFEVYIFVTFDSVKTLLNR